MRRLTARAWEPYARRLGRSGLKHGRRLARSGLAPLRVVPQRLPKPLVKQPDARLELALDHLISLRLLEGTELFFVQIGAFDGQTGDQIHDYVVRYGWSGILVEPQRKSFEALRRTYAGHPGLELRNVAITDRREQRALYTIRDAPGLPEWASQTASFDRAQVEKHRLAGIDGEDLIETEMVECITLTDLLVDVTHIDLLQVDVEGYDAEIIRMFDFARYRPRVVRFEHAHLRAADHDAAVTRLIEHGYEVAVTLYDTLAWLRDPPSRGG